MHIRLVLVAAALLLAGCTAPAANTDEPQQQDSPAEDHSNHSPEAPTSGEERVHLRGYALSAALVPIEGAAVSVLSTDLTATTGADGAFHFGELASRIYTLQASAPGFLNTTLTVTPAETASSIKLVMQAGYPEIPYNTTVSFRGILECAFEALIISPSCDSAITVVPGGPRLFSENQSFLFGADLGWKTLVLDIVFDGEAHPGLEGLRIAVRGSLDPDGGGEYTQYGRWNNPTSFTVHIEPGGNYTDGTEPVPQNATGFQVDVYPHGHAYHEVCAETSCFLGAGFAQNVEFDVYATLFYVEPAPVDFTLRSA